MIGTFPVKGEDFLCRARTLRAKDRKTPLTTNNANTQYKPPTNNKQQKQKHKKKKDD